MSLLLTHTITRGIFAFLALSIIGLVALSIGYQLLRVLKISPDWVTWIIGTLIIAGSLTLCIWLFLPHTSSTGFSSGDSPIGNRSIAGRLAFLLVKASNPHVYVNLIGIASVGLGIYASVQWLARQGFITFKKRAMTLLIQPTRNFLLFIRKQHQFLGWLAVIAAATHMIGYLPTLFYNQMYEIITGFIAIGVLALMAILGTWIWVDNSVRKHSTPKFMKNIHSSLTIVFFVILIMHI